MDRLYEIRIIIQRHNYKIGGGSSPELGKATPDNMRSAELPYMVQRKLHTVATPLIFRCRTERPVYLTYWVGEAVSV